jgi:hypothetical protein
VVTLLGQRETNMPQAFRLWDTGRNGFLSVAEIQTGLGKLLAGSSKADKSQLYDILAVAPPVECQQHLNTSFEEHDPIGKSRPMSFDQARQRLIKHHDTLEGFMFHNNMPNVPCFAKKGAKLVPAIDCTAISIDPKSVEAQQKKQAETPTNIGDVVDQFVKYLGANCHNPEKVNILEFLRATLPRAWLIKTQEVLTKDLLKSVFFCKVGLNAALNRKDRNARGRISVNDFRACINDMSKSLQAQGQPLLSESHIWAICEVAAGGRLQDPDREWIDYARFMANLRIIDAGDAPPSASAGPANAPYNMQFQCWATTA